MGKPMPTQFSSGCYRCDWGGESSFPWIGLALRALLTLGRLPGLQLWTSSLTLFLTLGQAASLPINSQSALQFKNLAAPYLPRESPILHPQGGPESSRGQSSSWRMGVGDLGEVLEDSMFPPAN